MTDDRLLRVNEDPRFLRVKKKEVKIKVDKRFKGMFKDEQFGAGKQVDRYGRVQASKKKSADLERFYQIQSDEDQEEEQVDAVSEPSSSDPSSSDASSDSEPEEAVMDEILAHHPLVSTEAPLGDASHRLAVVNLDWDLIKAVDLFHLAHAFKPPTGLVKSVKIYPSEFGKERMAQEVLEGPPRDLFATLKDHDGKLSDDAESASESASENGKEVDEQKLRKYQLESLRYYFAVIECDSVDTAAAIYRHCDGTEFEASANFIDMRFIPDEVTFGEEEATDVAFQLPRSYRPKPDVQTAALQQSKVTLTWDQDDLERQRATRALFYGHIDQEENDLKAYLASSQSESDDDDEAARERYRELLLAGEKENVFGRKSNEAGDLEITFASALKNKNKTKKEESDDDVDMEMTFNVTHSEEDEEDAQSDPDETIFEKQQRKLREKKRAKKEARLAEIKARREAERGNRKRKVDPEAEKKKAQLDLLLLDEQAEEDRHFDMREIVKSEKKKKAKKSETTDEFNMDLNDPRFQAMYESHSYAIDPSHPSFKKTKVMKQVIAERQKRLKPEH